MSLHGEGREVLIRPEAEPDRAGVRDVNLRAFDSPVEADLVDRLRPAAAALISLVAVKDEQIVGHILFSPVELVGHADLRIMGLGPMAVTPGLQRQGIGSALIRAGLARCAEQAYGAVVVLGHPQYYPRFGFSPAARYGIRCAYEAPEEAFMAIELKPGHLAGARGLIRYHAVFDGA